MKKYSTTILLLIIMCISLTANAQWGTLNSAITDGLQQVFFSNDTIGYALGSDGNIFKTTDGGQNWNNPSTVQSSSIFFTSADTGYACDGNFGTGIYQTTDSAASWNNIVSTADYITSFSFPGNGNIGYAAGNDSHDSLVIYKTADRGNSWNKFTTQEFHVAEVTIFFTDTNAGYFIDALNGILKTQNGGLSWSNEYADTSVSQRHSVLAIYFPASDTGYAVGDSGTILKTTDGVNWFYLSQSVTYDILTTVWFISTQKGFAADQSGNIIKTIDGGQNWTLSLNAGVNIASIYFSSPAVGYACGGNGEILKYGITTGLKQLTNESKFLLYPNPASNLLIVHAASSFSNETVIKIANMLGEVLKVENHNFGNELSFDIKDIPSGIYFISMTSENDKWVGKFVKE